MKSKGYAAHKTPSDECWLNLSFSNLEPMCTPYLLAQKEGVTSHHAKKTVTGAQMHHGLGMTNAKAGGDIKSPPAFLLVPKTGVEPARAKPTTPSRWRVYQFHHFGISGPRAENRLFIPQAAMYPPAHHSSTWTDQSRHPVRQPCSPAAMQEPADLPPPAQPGNRPAAGRKMPASGSSA